MNRKDIRSEYVRKNNVWEFTVVLFDCNDREKGRLIEYSHPFRAGYEMLEILEIFFLHWNYLVRIYSLFFSIRYDVFTGFLFGFYH